MRVLAKAKRLDSAVTSGVSRDASLVLCVSVVTNGHTSIICSVVFDQSRNDPTDTY